MAECSFIELAAGSIRAGTVQGYGKKARLVAFHEERITADEDELPRVLNAAVESIAARLRLTGRTLVFSLSSKFILFREVDFPFADRKRVQRTLPFQIEEKLPVPVDEVVIDSFEISSTSSASRWFACCVSRKIMRAVLEACSGARLDPVAVSPSFTGIPSLIPSGPSSLVIDSGSETTDLVLVSGGSVRYCRSLRLAGKTITRSVAEAMSVDTSIAEEAKLAHEGFRGRDTGFSEVITADVGRLARDIRLTLSALPADIVPSSISLVGGGLSFKGTDEYLSGKLSVPVSVIPADTIALNSSLERPATSGYLMAAGIAMAINAGNAPAVNFRKDEFAYHGVFDAVSLPLVFLLLFIAGTLGALLWHFDKAHKTAVSTQKVAYDKVAEWWISVMPADLPVPSALERFRPFIDEYSKKLDEDRDLKARYYSKSVLHDIKIVRNLIRSVELQFTLESIDANKSGVKMVIIANEDDSTKVNELITRARESYEVVPQVDTRPDGTKRYILSFNRKQEVSR